VEGHGIVRWSTSEVLARVALLGPAGVPDASPVHLHARPYPYSGPTLQVQYSTTVAVQQ
jgi:hypothetical protein